jgi:HEAT repeat protein
MSHKLSSQKPITAAELMDQLRQDSTFLVREQERERRLERLRKEARLAAAPVLEELAKAGFVLETVADLYNKKVNYKGAIPILLRWLPRVENVAVKESIVRALSVPWAKSLAAPALIEEFRWAQDPSGSGIKWAIANALSVVADDGVIHEMIDLIQDRQHGRARQMLAVALENMKDGRAVDVLNQLLKDEEVAGHALIALGQLKARSSRPLIEPFLNHEKAWVRKEAKKALAKIDKKRS